MIAVTGASGQVGGRVARLLGDAEHRLLVRDPTKAPRDARVEVRAAAYRDGPAMRAALDGADTLFLVSGRESADRVSEHRSAVDAAVAAGVRRIVYLSFYGAAPDSTFTFARDHWHTEQHIRATGLRHTFLRDNLYLDTLPILVGPDGVIRGPAGEGRVAAVSYDDVAAAAAAVLLDPGTGHDGVTYSLTGPEAFTLAEAAQALTVATGRPIRYQPETVQEAYASRAGYGAAEFEVDGWVSTYLAIAAGELATVTDDVQRLTGRRPRGLAEVLTGR